MFGDDTWIKLFPGMFERTDGTSSFYVSDFVEVDHNVTRHLGSQLRKLDWDVMILHYLGLDHIGHAGGPQSIHMGPKQVEMDEVIRRIYRELEMEKSLIVVCGDHGMNEVGNHGGSSPGETSPAMLLISPGIGKPNPVPLPQSENFRYYESVEQSDIVPTISALMGLPIPQNNLGVIIPQALDLMPQSVGLRLLRQNAKQLYSVFESSYPNFGRKISENCDEVSQIEFKAHCLYHQGIAKANKESYLRFMRLAQSLLSTASTGYNMKYMLIGLVLSLLGVLLAIYNEYSTPIEDTVSEVQCIAITLLNGLLMFASSFVEEEHYFWFWAATSHWILRLIIHSRSAIFKLIDNPFLGQVVLLRIIRAWNQTGQKWAGNPDIVSEILKPHPFLCAILVLLTYLTTFAAFQWRSSQTLPLASIRNSTMIALVMMFKLKIWVRAGDLAPMYINHVIVYLPNQDVLLARFIFVLLAAHFLITTGYMWCTSKGKGLRQF